jgi:hypothetical protein
MHQQQVRGAGGAGGLLSADSRPGHALHTSPFALPATPSSCRLPSLGLWPRPASSSHAALLQSHQRCREGLGGSGSGSSRLSSLHTSAAAAGEVVVPAMGDSITEGSVAAVLKQPGGGWVVGGMKLAAPAAGAASAFNAWGPVPCRRPPDGAALR